MNSASMISAVSCTLLAGKKQTLTSDPYKAVLQEQWALVFELMWSVLCVCLCVCVSVCVCVCTCMCVYAHSHACMAA